MGTYLSVGVLGLAAALSASFIPHFVAFIVAVVGNFSPILNETRGQPNLVMLLVICWSVRTSLGEALVWALVGGLMLDLLSILPLGASSAALALIAFAVNGIASQLLRFRSLFLLGFTAIATLLMTAWSFVALILLGSAYDMPAFIRLILLPTMIYNLVAVLPIYAVVRFLQRRLEGGLPIAPQSLTHGADMGPRE